MSLSVGTIAPDFTLVDNTLTSHTLSTYKGQNIVLAFFPASFTGVCEKELCKNYSWINYNSFNILNITLVKCMHLVIQLNT